ncbi:MAG: hypothetical protein HYX46_05095 [Betaproteobacteria bacterium]|nr:hypothetical protein [Betaproteobacteria bacterium]
MNIDNIISVARNLRSALLKQPGVLGVGHGWKVTAGQRTSRYAIVVYVGEKRPLAQVPRDQRIPKRLGGVPTDVVAVGKAKHRHADEREHRFINYLKIHGELAKSRPKMPPSTARDRVIGNVAVIEDDPNHSFILSARKDVDWVAAYKKFRLTHEDQYDFVTFWSDFEVNCECGAFYCGLVNPAKGINWEACLPGGRAGWGSQRLLGFMYFIRDDDAALLQEIGHHWMAYTGFKTKPTDKRASYRICLDNQPGHWSSYFDDDASPMDYDESELDLPTGVSVDWGDNDDGTFTPRRVGQGQYRFCNLDLYLMGLIPPEEVGNFYLIRNPRRVGGKIRGTRVTLNVNNIIWANGTRRPSVAKSPKSFTNAFVLLTKNASQATALARKIDHVRERYTAAFAAATGNRAHVSTTL